MASEQSIDGWFVRLGLILAALVGCGRATPPGALVGESEHFRLFVDPAIRRLRVKTARARPATVIVGAGVSKALAACS